MLILYLFIILTFCNSSSFAENAYIIEEAPPPGFENLEEEEQIVYIDVYYGGEFIEATMASFEFGYISFSDPRLLVESIPDIKEKERELIVKSLTGRLENNEHLLCTKKRDGGTFCGLLFPEVAGVIFDEKKYKVDVFINKKYVEKKSKEHAKLLPPSTSGLSFLDGFDTKLSGGPNNKSLDINNTSVFSYSATNLKVVSDYTRELYNRRSSSLRDPCFTIPDITGSLSQWGQSFQLGTERTEGGSVLLSSSDFLGFKMSNSLDHIEDKREIYGIPIELFLMSKSLVKVYKDGKLIHSSFYPSGESYIKTASFPSGTYDVLLRIQDASGNIIEETKFFTKDTKIPPIDYPLYYLGLGKAKSRGRSRVFHHYDMSVYNTGIAIRLLPQLSFSEDILGTKRVLASESSLTYLIQDGTKITNSLLFTRNIYGLSLKISTRFLDRISGSFQAAQIWERKYEKEEDLYFNPLPSIDKRFSASFGIPIGKARLSLNGTITKSKTREQDNESLGASISRNFSLNKDTSFNSRVSYSKDKRDYRFMVSLNFYLKKGKLRHMLRSNYQNNRKKTNRNLGFSSAWSNRKQGKSFTRASLDYYTDQRNRRISPKFSYDNNVGFINTIVAYNNPTKSDPNYQYNVKLGSGIVVLPGSFGVSNVNANNATGFLVYVDSPDPDDEFKIFINNSFKKIVKRRDTTFISVSPYKSYKVSMAPISKKIYNYKTLEKEFTLYPGNVQNVHWNAKEKFILATQIVDINNEPIRDYKVKGGGLYDQTDEEGNLQVEVLSDEKTLILENSEGKECNVSLPDAKDGMIFEEKLVCVFLK